MASPLRRLGVWGANLPTKKAKSVQPADFGIGCLIGQFTRGFKQAFMVQSPQDLSDIVGPQENSAYYGWDEVNGFFANTVGAPAKLYVVPHVNTVTPVQATQNVQNQTPANLLLLTDGYKGVGAWGAGGNRTGFTIVSGFRCQSTVSVAGLTGDAFITVAGPGAFRVGDTIVIQGAAAKVVTSVDMTTGKLGFAGTLGAGVSQGNTVQALGMQLHTWRKGLDGSVVEVDADLGRIFCCLDSRNTDYFVGNVFSQSKWWIVSRLVTTPATPDLDYPVTNAVISYPTNGADGTQNATLATEYATDLTYLTGLPFRFISVCESTDSNLQKSLETFCKGRTDTPIAIYNLPEAQSKSQLLNIGSSFQRSDDVLAVAWDKWLLVVDPFGKSTATPYRHVPNVGFMMGYWIRVISILGIHFAPCSKGQPLYGCADVSVPSTGDPTLDDGDRTDIANTGINVIQNILGLGIIPRNAFTPSTTLEFLFANGIVMRNFIKVSGIAGLQGSENDPNALNRIREDKMAMVSFLLGLWNKGSTGTVPVGETFGMIFNPDGSTTSFTDHVEVKADIINNPLDQLAQGNRNIDTWFTYPAPAGSIRVGVGFILRS